MIVTLLTLSAFVQHHGTIVKLYSISILNSDPCEIIPQIVCICCWFFIKRPHPSSRCSSYFLFPIFFFFFFPLCESGDSSACILYTTTYRTLGVGVYLFICLFIYLVSFGFVCSFTHQSFQRTLSSLSWYLDSVECNTNTPMSLSSSAYAPPPAFMPSPSSSSSPSS